MKKYILFFLFSIGITNISIGQINSTKISEIGIKYMRAYSDWNVDVMGTFYADSIHFQDPTAKEAFQISFDFTGKENVISMFRNVFKDQKPEHVAFKVKNTFESGSYVIFNSNYELIAPSSWFGKNVTDKVFISISVLTILKFKNDKIIEHIDYADYNSYKKQIGLQIN